MFIACIQRVVKTERPSYRPRIVAVDPELTNIVDLMRCCWDEYSGLRPSFGLVLDAISKVNKGKLVRVTSYTSFKTCLCFINTGKSVFHN